MPIKIALIQTVASRSREENVHKAISLARKAAEEKAQIVCFEELFNHHWFPRSIDASNYALAERVPGPTTETLSEVAKRYEMSLIVPLYEKEEEGIYYNTAVVIGPKGQIVGKYRKNHIPHQPNWEERFYFNPGNLGYPVFDLEVAKIGVLTCWDNFFPEAARSLGLQGAQIIFSPTAATFAFQPKWRKTLCANAIANCLFVARVNRVGEEGGQKFHGNSLVIDPEGEIIYEAGTDSDELLIADLELDMIKDTRNIWTFYAMRRPETYHYVTSPIP